MQSLVDAMPHFEDDEDPKRPRPVHTERKREGWMERTESRKDNERDHHRHVHVRC
jgi:hypothetical protein